MNIVLEEFLSEFSICRGDSDTCMVEFDDKILDDPHAHFLKPKDKAELELILTSIVKNLDSCSITDWGRRVNKVLTLDYLYHLADDFSSENIALEKANGLLRVKYLGKDASLQGKTSVLYRSQEIRTKGHLHITAEGCFDKTVEEDLPPVAACCRIKDYGGNAIIEHPCTKQWKFMYLLTNEQEDLETLVVMRNAHAAEVFNSMNTFCPLLFFHSSGYMFVSNLRAKKLVQRFKQRGNEIASVGASDNHCGSGMAHSPTERHFYLKRLGKAGTYMPKADIGKMEGPEFIAWKRQVYKEQNCHPLENYIDPSTFYREMIPPKAWKIFGRNNRAFDSIS